MQQTDEWLNIRKNKVGASDAPVIMDVSPWKTPYQLWEEKVGLRQGNKATDAMKRGISLEEKARESFSKKMNLIMKPDVVFHRQHDWMMASLDGIDDKRENIVEIKCAGREDHNLAIEGQVPKKYYPQLQHQMEVTGLNMAYYYSFDGNDGVVLEVSRDENYITAMVDAEKEFWNGMQDFIPPKMTSRDYVEHDDSEWVSYATELLAIRKESNNLWKREEVLKEKLIELAADRNCKGSGIKVIKMVSKGHIDYASIPYLQGKNLDKYRKKPTISWRIING